MWEWENVPTNLVRTTDAGDDSQAGRQTGSQTDRQTGSHGPWDSKMQTLRILHQSHTGNNCPTLQHTEVSWLSHTQAIDCSLHRTVLYCIVLTLLYYTTVHCTVVYYSNLTARGSIASSSCGAAWWPNLGGHYSTPQYIALGNLTALYSAVLRSTLECVAT